jgi:DNA-binding beta-propeller fold protein YncE
MKALRGAAIAIATLAGLIGCGGASHRQVTRARPTGRATPARPVRSPAPRVGAIRSTPTRVSRTADQSQLQALVTAQTEDRLLVVDLRTARVVRRIRVPGEPTFVATIGRGGPVVVVSSAAGTVTLLSGRSLRADRVLHGFDAAHIPAMAPGGGYAYITQDASGQLAVIRLTDDKVVSRTFVGLGAHHLAFSPDAQQVWVALGQSATTIAILSTVVRRPPPPQSVWADPGHPRLIGRFEPGYLAHDLLFTPDGRRVWITSADGPDVGVFSARDHALLFKVPAGPPPQHVVFEGRYAYVTSGYGSTIEQVALVSGRVLRRVRAPYGSFDLDAAGGFVVTSSLLRGTLAIYNPRLRLLNLVRLAPSAEDVAIFAP